MIETILATQEAFGTVTRIQVPISLREVFSAQTTEELLAITEFNETQTLIVTANGSDWHYGGF